MSRHPESRWTHPVCDDCWYREHFIAEPDDTDPRYTTGGMIELPIRLVDEHREWEQCCRCGSMTFSGIFVRGDPNDDDYKWWCMESDEHKADGRELEGAP